MASCGCGYAHDGSGKRTKVCEKHAAMKKGKGKKR